MADEFILRVPKARRVLVADPPWPFDDQLPGGGRGSDKHYENSEGKLDLDDIKAFPIPRMMSSSILFLWRVGAHAGEAEDVARAWGFEPKSEIVWRKWRVCSECAGEGGTYARRAGRPFTQKDKRTPCSRCKGHRLTPDGPSVVPHTGMGHYVRWSHETCIIAARKGGKMPERKNTNVSLSVLDALVPLIPGTKRPQHSAKPDEFYVKVQSLYAGPYVELFGRKRRPGWLVFGDEVA